VGWGDNAGGAGPAEGTEGEEGRSGLVDSGPGASPREGGGSGPAATLGPKKRKGFPIFVSFSFISKPFQKHLKLFFNFGSKPLHMQQNACKTMLLHLIMNFNLIKICFLMFS
jgi:hypothetical protein